MTFIEVSTTTITPRGTDSHQHTTATTAAAPSSFLLLESAAVSGDQGGSNDDASMRLESARSILSLARSAKGVNYLLETLRQGNPSQRTWVDDSVPQKEQQQLAVMLLNACSGQGPEVDGGGHGSAARGAPCRQPLVAGGPNRRGRARD